MPDVSDAPIHALCLNIIDRGTGEVESQTKFFPSEASMPGYVESVERGYEGTRWRTERIWLLPSVQAEVEGTPQSSPRMPGHDEDETR